MDPVLYVQQLLQPVEVPVLLPGEFTLPQHHRKAGNREITGLRAYLTDLAPVGYIQLQDPTGMISDGITDQVLQLVDIIAPGATDEAARVAAQNLAHLARLRLGHTGRVSTRLRYQRDQLSVPVETGIWRVQQVYTMYLAFGQA